MPDEVQIKDCIWEGENIAIEWTWEIDRCEAPITYPGAVHTAYPYRTWMVTYPRDIVVPHTQYTLWIVEMHYTLFNGFPELFNSDNLLLNCTLDSAVG